MSRSKGGATRALTVGAVHVLDLLDALRDFGIAPDVLCDAVGLDHIALHDLAARVPTATVIRLFAEAERRTGDPAIGLRAGGRAKLRGVIDQLVLSSPSVTQAVREARRFSRLVADTLRIDLQTWGDKAKIIFHPGDAAIEASHHAVEYLVTVAMRSFERARGTKFHLHEVDFVHSDYGCRTEAERLFGCPVRYDEPHNGLVLPSADLETASRYANPLLAAELENFAAALAAQTTAPATISERVTDVSRVLLTVGQRADFEVVARELGMPRRTLQRRLDEENASFKELRDTVLREVASALLSNPAVKIESVALNLGFSDLAAFSKAFKRWEGTTPTSYRASILAAAKRERASADSGGSRRPRRGA